MDYISSVSQLHPSWQKVLENTLNQPYFIKLLKTIDNERLLGTPIFPAPENVFTALKTPYDQVRVVIVGQDPYHGIGQAHGLSFSVPKGCPFPPSLKNIFKELKDDLGLEPPKHGCLESWAAQGVLLLNATLTVREGEPLSHHGLGWERFTDAVIEQLILREDPVIFVLWGKNAQEKYRLIAKNSPKSNIQVLFAPHPSPLSAYQGFFGCKHFSKINEILIQNGKKPLDWQIL